MTERIRTFWSPELEGRFISAYDAVLRQWPVPYKERFVPTRFGGTHVIVSGPQDAPALVLFHPAGGGSTIWYRNVGPWSKQYRVLAVDVIGDLNLSIMTRLVRRRKDFADWTADVLDGLGCETAFIVGNSYGGYVALSTALYLPQRVRKVALISPAATFNQIWPIYWHTIIPGYWIAPLIRSESLVHKSADWVFQGFPRDDCTAELRRLSHISGYPRYRPTHNPPPLVFSDQELRSIQTPVLLLIGDHEVIYKPQRVMERAKRLLPDVQAEIVPNANHCAQYTNPDFVNARIIEFFAGSRSAEPAGRPVSNTVAKRNGTAPRRPARPQRSSSKSSGGRR